MARKSGKVYIVGAGPGHPELITLRGVKLLSSADVVIYDYLVDESILRYAKEGAELIRVNRDEKATLPFIMLKKAKEGKRIVRLKNGDPVIFGRIAEEMLFLKKHHIDYEIVPGVTAGIASAGFSGIPLTARGVSASVVFVTGHEDLSKEGGFVNWEKVASIDTLVIYMGVENLSEIVTRIIKFKGPTTPVAIIEKASTSLQRVIVGTLSDIRERAEKERVSPPAIIIIGEVVRYKEKFDWFGKAKKVLYTGLLNKEGSDDEIVFHLPLVEVREVGYSQEIERFFSFLKTFDILLFTTPYTVSYFYKYLLTKNMDSRCLAKVHIACAGFQTRNELRARGILPDIFPEDGELLSLMELIKEYVPKCVGVLLPGTGESVIVKVLIENGIEAHTCRLYELISPSNLPDINLKFFDEIIFPNSQSLLNFVRHYGLPPSGVKVVTTNRKVYEVAKEIGLIPVRGEEYVEVI